MSSLDLSSLMGISLGTLTLGKVISAAVTLLICLVVIRVLMKLLNRLLSRSKLDARVQKYLAAGVRLILYVITVLIVVDSLGIPVTSLVALWSVGSLGITRAAEDILGHVAGGLVILSARPFALGDFLEVGGTSGTVEEISLNHTKLITPDGLMVLLPNKELASSQMTNYTVNGRRRITWKVSASYDAPTEHLLKDPAPSVRLTGYGDSAIEYAVYCWAEPADYWDAYFALGEHLRTAFADHGVEMTYNHLNVHILDKKD